MSLMWKRRKIENIELQSLQNVVKEGGPNVVTNFEKKFKDIKIEGKRKVHNSSLYTEKLPSIHYTEAEHEEIETLYMGKESLSRLRHQRSRSWSQQRGQSQEGRIIIPLYKQKNCHRPIIWKQSIEK